MIPARTKHHHQRAIVHSSSDAQKSATGGLPVVRTPHHEFGAHEVFSFSLPVAWRIRICGDDSNNLCINLGKLDSFGRFSIDVARLDWYGEKTDGTIKSGSIDSRNKSSYITLFGDTIAP
jgi:hypothetical protein